MAGWHHGLDGRKSEWTPGVGDGQGGLACCNSWGHKELDTTQRLNWTEDFYKFFFFLIRISLHIFQGFLRQSISFPPPIIWFHDRIHSLLYSLKYMTIGLRAQSHKLPSSEKPVPIPGPEATSTSVKLATNPGIPLNLSVLLIWSNNLWKLGKHFSHFWLPEFWHNKSLLIKPLGLWRFVMVVLAN